MTAQSRNIPVPMGRKEGLRRDFLDFARVLRSLTDPYRPELHYMRGPGPKWYAKHGRPAAADAPAVPGLARIEG